MNDKKEEKKKEERKQNSGTCGPDMLGLLQTFLQKHVMSKNVGFHWFLTLRPWESCLATLCLSFLRTPKLFVGIAKLMIIIIIIICPPPPAFRSPPTQGSLGMNWIDCQAGPPSLLTL